MRKTPNKKLIFHRNMRLGNFAPGFLYRGTTIKELAKYRRITKEHRKRIDWLLEYKLTCADRQMVGNDSTLCKLWMRANTLYSAIKY